MNRHERRVAAAMARANKRSIGMVCAEEIIRDPDTCVTDFQLRLLAIADKYAGSAAAILVQPGKLVHPETHEIYPLNSIHGQR